MASCKSFAISSSGLAWQQEFSLDSSKGSSRVEAFKKLSVFFVVQDWFASHFQVHFCHARDNLIRCKDIIHQVIISLFFILQPHPDE